MPGRLTLQQTRWLILGLLLAAVFITVGAFLLKRQYRHAPELPPLMTGNVRESQGFSLSQTEQGRAVFKLKAQRVREQESNGKSLLEEVEIITFGGQGNRQDRIYTHLCEYDPGTGTVTSRGETQIELGPPNEPAHGAAATPPADAPQVTPVPQAPPPAGGGAVQPSILVKTSGVTFEQKTGIVRTDQPLEFTFARGKGKAVGAVYNSNLRQLHLKSAVEIETLAHNASDIANAPNAGPAPLSGIPVFITASALDYQQKTGEVRVEHIEMRRPTETGGMRQLSGDHGVVNLDDENRATRADITGHARVNELLPAHQGRTARETHLASDELHLWFTPEQSLKVAVANGNVALQAVTARERSTTTAGRMEMIFREEGENELSTVTWTGDTRIRMVPVQAGGDTRLISSNAVMLFMKPGGREPETAQTVAPGRIELLPALQPAGAARRRNASRRILSADKIWMKFGDESELKDLTADGHVRLESQRLAAQRPASAAPPPVVTTSDQFGAAFRNGDVYSSTQTGHFHYAEGERQANAERAGYTASDERIELVGRPGSNPEVWDAATRTTAVRIVLDQKNDVGIAERDVRTVYQPTNGDTSGKGTPAAASRTAGNAGSMAQVPGPLASDRPVYVVADRMVTSSKTGVTRYEASAASGRVRLWQDQDVIEAHTIVLERNARRLQANGKVTTVLVENTSDKPAGAGLLAENQPAGRAEVAGATSGRAATATPRATFGQPATQAVVIKADALLYTENDHRAHYERHVVFRRGPTLMDSDVLDAFLLPAAEVKPGESRLRRAIGRGNVRINQSAPTGNRRAESEVAEYSTAEEKMTLSGGNPYVFDENRGYTRGRQLTYYLRDDSIFVHGDGASRTVTEQWVRKRR